MTQTRDYFYRLIKGIRACIGSPYDKELVSSNIEEIAYLMKTYCEYKQRFSQTEALGDTLQNALRAFRQSVYIIFIYYILVPKKSNFYLLDRNTYQMFTQ